jgi:hypothetical protein
MGSFATIPHGTWLTGTTSRIVYSNGDGKTLGYIA